MATESGTSAEEQEKMVWNTTGNGGIKPAEFLGTTDARPLVVKTNTTEAMRIDESQRVGVGNGQPQNRLHVGNGTTKIAADRVTAVVANNTPDAGIAIAQRGGVNVMLQASDAGGYIGTTSDHPLVLRTNDQDRLVVKPNGDVQVGPGSSTIAESRVNAVVASNEPDAGIAIAQNSGVNLLLQASGGGGYIGTTSDHPLVLRTNDQDRLVVKPNGDVQVGPGSSTIAESRVNAVVASNEPDAGIAIAQNSGVNLLLQASGGGGYLGTTSNHPLVLRTNDQDRVVIDNAGNLIVNADILLSNADCAEDFDVAEGATVEPGTVMVVGDDGRLQHAVDAYDRRVAGVIAGAGSYRPAIVLDRQPSGRRRGAISLVGKVFCKVDANYAPISVGDLLTTSETPGHAMSADDPARAFGAVLGKALRPLPAGLGLIPVLIALQ